MRKFETGATRDSDTSKLDYEGFLSPLVLKRYAEYMNKNRIQADGNVRDSDNWQKGIPLAVYMKSLWRHFLDVWAIHRCLLGGGGVPEGFQEDSLCAVLFNASGYLHEVLKEDKEFEDSPADSMATQEGTWVPWNGKDGFPITTEEIVRAHNKHILGTKPECDKLEPCEDIPGPEASRVGQDVYDPRFETSRRECR